MTQKTLRYRTRSGWVTKNDKLAAVEVDDNFIAMENDLANTTDPAKGAGMVGWYRNVHGFVGRTLASKLSDTVSVKDFGAVGDGVTDDTVALADAFTSGKHIFIPAGTYIVSSQLTISGSNLVIKGVGYRSKISSPNLINPILLSGLNNVAFEDLAFETTVSDATENLYGIIRSENTELIDVTFLRCGFSAAGANTNAIKVINETAPISDQVRLIECRFENIWRMAIEWQNHAADTAVRYRGITIERCFFKNIGLAGGYGFAISLSGHGENCAISNNTFQNVKLGLELVGTSDTTVAFNKFVSFLAGGKPFSFTGSRTMYRNRVVGNTLEGAASADTYIWSQQDLVMHGNYWHHNSSTVYFRDVVRLRASDDQYDTSGHTAAFIEGESNDNQFVNCRISNRRSANNFSTFRCYGATVVDTWLIGCYLDKGTGGVSYDGANGAEVPRLYLCKGGGTGPSFLSSIVRQGHSYKNGFFKTAGAGVGFTAITIDFGVTESWNPAMVAIRVRTTKNDSGGSGYTENRLYINHQGSTNVVVENTQVIGVASNLTITTSTSGTILTVTCTHASATGDQLYFLWDVEVDSTNMPVVA